MPDTVHIHIDLRGPGYESARYAFRVLLGATDAHVVFHDDFPRELSPEAALITYSVSPYHARHRRHLVIHASRRLWEHYGQPASLPPSPLPSIPTAALAAAPGERLGDPMVVPYVAEGPSAAVAVTAPSPDSAMVITTSMDLVASTFFWITSYEERFIQERDEVGRIPHSSLRVIQERLSLRPLVDEYGELLVAWLRRLGLKIACGRPPFRAMLTHDVDFGIGVNGIWDHADNALRTFYREAFRQRRPRTALLGLRHWVLRGLNVCHEPTLFRDIVNVDADFGFPSFFFLMANGTHPRDAAYDISSKAAHAVIEAVSRAGGDIGLHVGLDAHRTPDQLRKEWESLRRAAPRARPAARSHYLSFFAPRTWRQLGEVGFTADSTLGFSHQMGFRSGTCRAFRPFDVESGEVLPIWEFPMTLMDMNLFHHGHERFHARASDADRVAAVRELADRVKAHRGCLVINWHNTSFFGHYLEVYRAILADLRGAQAIGPDSVPAVGGAVIW
jgi:hypothetical protein